MASINNSFNIILNNSNLSNTITNASFTYNFIGGGFLVEKDDQICISSITIPYSNYNINQQVYNDTSYSFTLSGAATPSVFNPSGTPVAAVITMPNGFYAITDINNYFQQWAIANNFYKTNTSTGQNFFYFTIYTNVSAYANQVIISPVESGAQAGFTYPAQFPFSTGSYIPQLIISSTNKFGSIIGWAAGSYPYSGTLTSYAGNLPGSSYSAVGTVVPNATPVNNYIISCSLVNNPITFPTNILDSMPITSTFGSNIIYQPTFPKWVDMNPGRQAYLTITFLDQNLNTVYFNDYNVLISLLIRKSKKSKYLLE